MPAPLSPDEPAAALTVSTNDVEALVLPSLTAKVIVVVPVWSGAGVISTLRLALLPLIKSEVELFGTTVASLDCAVTTRFVSGVSTSPTLNVR
jgi:hypothetical protein